MLIQEDRGIQLLVYYVSHSMVLAETRYLSLEKLASTLLVASSKLRPYFQAHLIVVFTYHPLGQVVHYLEGSGLFMWWSMELSQYEISHIPRVIIKGKVMTDFIVELTPNEEGEVSPNPSSTVEKSLVATC